MIPRTFLILVALLSAGGLAAQQIRVVPPRGGGALIPPRTEEDQVGVAVEMFENPNLDRYLEKAQNFLDREDWAGAISVLQDVVEGRTVEVEMVPDEGDEDPAESGDEGEEATAGEPGDGPTFGPELDANEAVYSEDGRIYRPVRRMCMEMLATMGPRGLELYRRRFGARAEAMLAGALDARDLPAIETVYRRYFVTDAAGRAMAAAGDLMMDQGRFRGAIQVYRDLLEIYPGHLRESLGIDEVWVRFKIALCLRLLGDEQRARQALVALAEDHPEDSLRLMGELSPLAALPSSGLFRSDALDHTARAAREAAGQLVLRGGDDSLVPLWQFLFAERRPYRPTREDGNRTRFMMEAGVSSVGPEVDAFVPGTRVQFLGDRVLFLDHHRLREHRSLSGLMLRATSGELEPPMPRAGRPRSRVPVYDWATMQVVADGERYYTVLGPDRRVQGVHTILSNRLVAHGRADLEPVWSSEDWQAGEMGLDGATFLAAPTPFGDRLLVPVLHRDAYCLQCLSGTTGEPLWRTRLHSGGTQFARAPGSPVKVEGGIAYCLTNAGALAAVDAVTGNTRWIRKYERLHPLRKRRGAAFRLVRGRGRQWLERDLHGFANGGILVVDGLVVFAPSDGRVVHCLDGTTGAAVWMLSGDSHGFAPYREFETLVGYAGGHLFARSRDELVCIDVRTGVRKWFSPIPRDEVHSGWRGRGTVTDAFVLLPGRGHVLLHPVDGPAPWQRIDCPPFSVGREPPDGPANLFVHGPCLALVYEAGIEVYSSHRALDRLAGQAESALEQVDYLAQAGRLHDAIGVLDRWLGEDDGSDPRARRQAVRRMLSLGRDVAMAMIANGRRAEALEVLDRCRPHCEDRQTLMQWHLARLELFEQLQDLDARAAEQRALYRIMEGRK